MITYDSFGNVFFKDYTLANANKALSKSYFILTNKLVRI